MERFDLLINNFNSLSSELITIKEQLVNEKDEFFNTIVENSPNFISIVQDQKYVFVNARGLELFKCRNSSDIIGKNIFNTVHQDYRCELQNLLAESIKNTNNQLSLRFIGYDNNSFDFEGSLKSFSYNKKDAFLIIGNDITEDIEQKEKIKLEQELRSNILNSFNEVVALYEPNHRMKWLNKAGKEQLGYKDESYVGEFCYKVWFGKNLPCPNCPVGTKTRKPVERIVTFPDESNWMVRHIPMFDVNHEINGYIEFRENVTENEKIRKELKNSHTRLDKAEHAALLGHFEIDLIYNKTIFSKGALNILECNSEIEIADNENVFFKFIHPEDKERINIYFIKSLTYNEKFDQIFRIIDFSGKIKTIHGIGSIADVKLKKGKYFFCTIQDISQIQALKVQIENEEIKYRLLAENSPVGVGLVYKNELIYANKTLFDIIGYQSTLDFKLIELYQYINQTDRKSIYNIIEIIKSGDAIFPIRLQIRFYKKNDEEITLKLIVTECLIEDKMYIQAIIIDLTKEMEIERKNKQITIDSLYVNQKNKILHEIEIELRNIINKNKTLKNNEFINIFNIINSYSNLDRDWEILKSHFEEIHSAFFQRMQDEYPALTANDLKHCACIKLNFTTKEIARFFNVKVSSIQIARVRLKKKMNLSDVIDLRTHILSF